MFIFLIKIGEIVELGECSFLIKIRERSSPQQPSFFKDFAYLLQTCV